nr:metal-dependent hydrolase [uncultured Holophaga sp.]
MPTALSHTAVPLALSFAVGRSRIPRAVLVAGIVLSMLPDLDVVAFKLGIPYTSAFGHRGFSHSLLFAAASAVLVAGVLRLWKHPFPLACWFLFVSAVSHGCLDACTSGGQGVAFLWPFSEVRYFAPFRPIRVSPISLVRFFSSRGVAVIWSELVWIWFGSALAALGIGISRHCVGNRA